MRNKNYTMRQKLFVSDKWKKKCKQRLIYYIYINVATFNAFVLGSFFHHIFYLNRYFSGRWVAYRY